MLEVKIEEQGTITHLKASGDVVSIAADTLIAIKKIYDSIADSDKTAGEFYKKFIKMSINDKDSPLFKLFNEEEDKDEVCDVKCKKTKKSEEKNKEDNADREERRNKTDVVEKTLNSLNNLEDMLESMKYVNDKIADTMEKLLQGEDKE